MVGVGASPTRPAAAFRGAIASSTTRYLTRWMPSARNARHTRAQSSSSCSSAGASCARGRSDAASSSNTAIPFQGACQAAHCSDTTGCTTVESRRSGPRNLTRAACCPANSQHTAILAECQRSRHGTCRREMQTQYQCESKDGAKGCRVDSTWKASSDALAFTHHPRQSSRLHTQLRRLS